MVFDVCESFTWYIVSAAEFFNTNGYMKGILLKRPSNAGIRLRKARELNETLESTKSDIM